MLIDIIFDDKKVKISVEEIHYSKLKDHSEFFEIYNKNALNEMKNYKINGKLKFKRIYETSITDALSIGKHDNKVFLRFLSKDKIEGRVSTCLKFISYVNDNQLELFDEV